MGASSRCHLSVSMFSFQAIHNCNDVRFRLSVLSFISVNVLFSSNSQPERIHMHLFAVVIYQCQCSLFKQFTTCDIAYKSGQSLSFISVNVLFSSNSQPKPQPRETITRCHLSVSMFSFQAIHNLALRRRCSSWVVIYQCQCSLFKQFTTRHGGNNTVTELSFISVNVLFSSNSQPTAATACSSPVVIYQCQCSLFKQFTTHGAVYRLHELLSFISVNVLFSSNSQHIMQYNTKGSCCHLSVSMFSFQAIHN